MRELLDRDVLHGLFVDELRRHPGGAESEFVFEIDHRPEDADGCNWYPLATIEQWRGDVMGNLAAFREVRERLSARYNVRSPSAEPSPAPSVTG